jgi:hypothetical protein
MPIFEDKLKLQSSKKPMKRKTETIHAYAGHIISNSRFTPVSLSYGSKKSLSHLKYQTILAQTIDIRPTNTVSGGAQRIHAMHDDPAAAEEPTCSSKLT